MTLRQRTENIDRMEVTAVRQIGERPARYNRIVGRLGLR